MNRCKFTTTRQKAQGIGVTTEYGGCAIGAIPNDFKRRLVATAGLAKTSTHENMVPPNQQSDGK
jgi:hypothetical protein